MIEADKRKAIYLLHSEGMSVREISRRVKVSRNAVKMIIKQEGVMPSGERSKQTIDDEVLRRLYNECSGRIQRMHEKLTEEEGIAVTYPTLTRMLRRVGISKGKKKRCDRVPDEPGVEMQHDTSLYEVKFSGKKVRVIASMIYLRYSKRRYLKFYRVFNRFTMKCFLHKALMHWGYSARNCIIDNTNLARLRGTGANAVIVAEMVRFGEQYGFDFICHEKNHANRKAGEERSFYTVETNFFPGRTFRDLEDMNQQALAWSTVRMENRPQTKAKLIPAKAFEYERSYLTQLPAHLPAPYRSHYRETDQYGYATFDGNYFWVPGTGRHKVKLLEYSDCLKIYQSGSQIVEYCLPPNGVKNKLFSPPGQPKPRYQPKNRRKPTHEEEKRLRSMEQSVSAYLDFALKPKGIQRHNFVRKLYGLSRTVTPSLFVATIQRAHKYKITDIPTIERIVSLIISQGTQTFPVVRIEQDFRNREAYEQGRLTDCPDLSKYKDPTPKDDRHG